MRYKSDHKEETRRRILDAASQEFRIHGFEGVGIARLMGALELTHGGFYAHFADKESLVAESCVVMIDQSLEMMLNALKSGGFPMLLDYYLSEGHRDNPALGCLLPTLAAEVARHQSCAREAFTQKLVEAYWAIAEYMPGPTPERKFEKVTAMFASLVGAVSLARAVSDPALSKTLLGSTRDYLLHFIEDTSH